MHGDVAHPEQAVITKDDYESYDSRRHLFSTALLGENRREHYCLLRRVQRKDFTTNAEYQYARAKQELQVRDLRRYGIMGLLVDDYSHYTDVLRRILFRYKLARVFISGSAAEYHPWSEQKAQDLLQTMS